MTNPTALVGELEAMQERLRSTAVVLRGEPVSLQLADGTTIQGSTGDITSAINPDGPAAADAIDKAIATLKAQREALERIADGSAFREQRFAEDNDPEYFLRAQRNVQKFARASIEGNPTT